MEYKPMKKYELLDAFRGVAILWIVSFHLLSSTSEHYGFIIDAIVKYGLLGVPIFFVISGYGIAASTSASDYHQPYIFLIRRLKKIFYTYWWSLPISVFFFFKSYHFHISSPYSITDWFTVATLTKVFSATSWNLHTAFEPLNPVIWFLPIIVQIYLYVTVCLYYKKYISSLMLIGFFASLLTYIGPIKKLLPYGFFLPYFSQFYVGFIVYSLIERRFAFAIKIIIQLIFLLISGILYYLAMRDYQFLGFSIAFLIGYLLFALHNYDQKITRLVIVRIFIIMGAFSYSLYLLHYPLQVPADILARHLLPFQDNLIRPLVEVAIVIILSFIWYLFFERPSSQSEILRCLASPFDTVRTGLKNTGKKLFET